VVPNEADRNGDALNEAPRFVRLLNENDPSGIPRIWERNAWRRRYLDGHPARLRCVGHGVHLSWIAQVNRQERDYCASSNLGRTCVWTVGAMTEPAFFVAWE